MAGDLPAIECFDPFLGDRPREIAEAHMLVAEVNCELAGYLSWLPAGFIGRDFIAYLSVSEPFRRKRVASALISSVIAILAPGRVFISTEFDNTAMLTLLDRSGWVCAGAVEGVNQSGQAEVFFYRDV